MATSKTAIILLFAALLTAQVSSKSVPKLRDDGNGDDNEITIVINVALEILSAILKIVSAAVDTGLDLANDALEAAASRSDEIQQQIVKASEVVVDKAKEALSKELEKLKNVTSEAGVDIIECAEAANASIVASADKAINASADCTVDLVVNLLVDLEAVIADLENTNKQIEKYEDDITTCRNATDAKQCVLDDIQTIIKTATELGDNVKNDIAIATDSFNKLGQVTTTCVKPNTDVLDDDIKNIFTVFSSCVQDKINS